MADSLLRTDRELADIYARHVDMVYRICFTFMKNTADTEDMVQAVFLRLLKSPVDFRGEEHEKAWLIVTARNVCRDALKHWWSKREPLDENRVAGGDTELLIDETLQAVLDLPDKYKIPVYLYYYEGYDSVEIGSILQKSPSAVRNLMREGRKRLRHVLENHDAVPDGSAAAYEEEFK